MELCGEKKIYRRNDGTPSKKKFFGFNFYLQCNGKLSKKNRERLLSESRIHLGEIWEGLGLSDDMKIRNGVVNELDSNLLDIELLDIWNSMYLSFGYLITEFREKWEKEKIKEYQNGDFKLSSEFELLSERVSILESVVKRLDTNQPVKRIIGMG